MPGRDKGSVFDQLTDDADFSRRATLGCPLLHEYILRDSQEWLSYQAV